MSQTEFESKKNLICYVGNAKCWDTMAFPAEGYTRVRLKFHWMKKKKKKGKLRPTRNFRNTPNSADTRIGVNFLGVALINDVSVKTIQGKVSAGKKIASTTFPDAGAMQLTISYRNANIPVNTLS